MTENLNKKESEKFLKKMIEKENSPLNEQEKKICEEIRSKEFMQCIGNGKTIYECENENDNDNIHNPLNDSLIIKKPLKFDKGKPRLDLVTPEFIFETGKIMGYGAKKYALQRHLWKWWGGEENDEETGESHLSHACCCLMMLLTASKRKIGVDTRWKK